MCDSWSWNIAYASIFRYEIGFYICFRIFKRQLNSSSRLFKNLLIQAYNEIFIFFEKYFLFVICSRSLTPVRRLLRIFLHCIDPAHILVTQKKFHSCPLDAIFTGILLPWRPLSEIANFVLFADMEAIEVGRNFW